MMKMSGQTIRIAACIALVVMLGAALWGFAWMNEQRGAAESAAARLAEGRRMVERIMALRSRPQNVGTEEVRINEMSVRIEKAAIEASMRPADQIVSIWPQPARRVADTAYMEKPTSLLLQNVTLKQVGAFITRLTEAGMGLQCASVRLAAPQGIALARNSSAGESEVWSVELSLAYLIYSPTREVKR